MLHVPVLRSGRAYRSLDRVPLRHVATGQPIAEVSQASAGLIGRDLAQARSRRRALDARSIRELCELCRRAAELFATAELPLDPESGAPQGPVDYVRQLSATTGFPETLARANLEKIRFVLAEMPLVLSGLTRGLDPAALDAARGQAGAGGVSYALEADDLGAVLPSNSPGVHGLWLPAVALGVPLTLKPGRFEPWTPLRICQALMAAGCPPEACGFYPSGYDGAVEILLRSSRSMLFGEASTVGPWASDPRIQLHGPGWSKVLFGPGVDPLEYTGVVETSIASNGGRSCLNASSVWAPEGGRDFARVLARSLAAIEPLPLTNPRAALAAFSDPRAAHRISERIDALLAEPGAEDLTALERGPERVVEIEGATFLRPTLVWCADPDHPLAKQEFLFPFAAVVDCEPDEVWQHIGPTLVATVISDDERFRSRALASREIDRLNLGPIPTSSIAWDQPHEGNLFEHLYRRRALQAAIGA